LLEEPRFDPLQLVPALHHIGEGELWMFSEALIGIHADFCGESSTKLPTDAQNKYRASLRIIHQSLNALGHSIEVKPGLRNFVACHKLAIEVLIDVVEWPLRHIIDGLDF